MTIQIEWDGAINPSQFDVFIDGLRKIEAAAHTGGRPEPLRAAVWRASLSGTTTGAAVYVVEGESLSALAEVDECPQPAV